MVVSKRPQTLFMMICLLFVALFTVTFMACDPGFFPPGDDEQEEGTSEDEEENDGDEEEVVEQYIHNLGVEFAPYDSSTGRAGAFVFSNRIEKPILEFGQNTIGKSGRISAKDNPAFEYHLHPDAEIFAVADGVVDRFLFLDETGDHMLRTRWPGSNLEIIYDHVTNPQFELGDTIMRGDFIGNPGCWDPGYVGRTEIQISTGNDDEDNFLSHCPFDVFDPDSLEVYTARVSRLIEEWENFKEDTTIYDEENFVYPCCVNLSLVP
ncbi:MAG: hypothetical protein U5N56_12070 [Candidatus Marinimicrobia bacterium]|nr:hypothetical protein [Candidatus Neomarinimicrobiota bacterium]